MYYHTVDTIRFTLVADQALWVVDQLFLLWQENADGIIQHCSIDPKEGIQQEGEISLFNDRMESTGALMNRILYGLSGM